MDDAVVAERALSDEALLARHRNGDAGAFGDLYDRHARGLFAFALGLTREWSAAQDVVQEAFLRLLGARPDAVRPFLFAAALNLVRDEARRRAVRLRAPARPEEQPAPADWSFLEDLDVLPAERREVLLMKVFGGFSFAEIGELLGIPLSTAATRHQAAVEALERSWRADP